MRAQYSSPRRLSVLALQSEPCPIDDDDDDPVKGVERWLRMYPHTSLVVLPELHLHPRRRRQTLEELAEPVPGPLTDRLGRLARRLGVWFVPGSIYERGEDGEIFNTALVFSDAGELVATYRKCFPWRPFEETAAGTSFVVFDIPSVGRIGLSICYDLWFPELARHLAWMGAEVILQPTCTYTSDRRQELVLAKATAVTHQVFVVNVNAAAPFAAGRSLIVDPEGNVRAKAGELPAALADTFDLSDVSRVRSYGTAGADRVWRQFEQGGKPLELPLYEGRLVPERWEPARFGAEVTRASVNGDAHGEREAATAAAGDAGTIE